MEAPMLKLSKIGKLVKDAWHMVGITILLFCLIEGSLSLAFLIKDRFLGSDLSTIDPRVAADTYSDPSWAGNYYEEFRRANIVQWRSYVYWRRKPFFGSYINIDSDGIRQTTVTEPQGSSASMKVFMFGGSTMWGTGVGDASTIPSILAKELQNQGVVSNIINFGEVGYVSTQEVITLMLQLQKGHIPDLVIFYDGLNDTYSAYQQHIAGLPQNEFNRVKDFNLSKPYGFKQRREMIFQDVATRLSTIRFLKYFPQRLGLRSKPGLAVNPAALGNSDADSQALAQAVISTYTSNVELVKALSEHYHFKYLFYWQPTIFQKVNLTKYERAQRDVIQPMEQFFQKTHSLIQQSGLVASSEESFHDLSLLFSDIQQPIYVDCYHLGESGNKLIAQRMAKDVLSVIPAHKGVAEQK